MRKSALCVRVETSEKSFASAMNEFRSWLDTHRIQPIYFRHDGSDSGVAVEITFSCEDEARLFEQTFTRP